MAPSSATPRGDKGGDSARIFKEVSSNVPQVQGGQSTKDSKE
jgi:hypothetical protein